MTGITRLRMYYSAKGSLNIWSPPGSSDAPAIEAASEAVSRQTAHELHLAMEQQSALQLRRVMLSHLVTCMPLLKSLEAYEMPLSLLVSAAAALHSSCPALTDFKICQESDGGREEWGDLWSALAGARSLRRVDVHCVNKLGTAFENIRLLDQLHSLHLSIDIPVGPDDPWYGSGDCDIALQLSRMTGITEVRAHCRGLT